MYYIYIYIYMCVCVCVCVRVCARVCARVRKSLTYQIAVIRNLSVYEYVGCIFLIITIFIIQCFATSFCRCIKGLIGIIN